MVRKHPLKKEPGWVVSELPGRLRLEFARPMRETDLDAFLSLAGVREVTYNKISRSLLIRFDKDKTSLHALKQEIESNIPRFVLRKIADKSYKPNGDMLSQLIYGCVSKVNSKVNRKLRGRADLTSIVPTGLMSWALIELIRNPAPPRWYDIIRAAETMYLHFSKEYCQ